MKQLPIGIQDFRDVRDEDYYFVDKSMLIGRILDWNDDGVFLITRPRRFGKSLNLSMMDAFFNIRYKGNTWFDDLEISKHHEYDGYKNAFPVISIDLRLDCIESFSGFMELINSAIYSTFDRYTYLRDSPKLTEESKSMFTTLYAGTKTVADSEFAFNCLCSMLEEHHGKKVIVLIDDYDSAVNSIADEDLRHDVLSFMKGMLSYLLKGNRSLQMGIIMGTTHIIMGDDFGGGLNNVIADNILDKKLDEMFGFTDDEVEQICVDYGNPEKFAEAKEWYGGYRFGDADICNPWDLMKYVENGFEHLPHWKDVRDDSIIEGLMINADERTLRDLETLGSGDCVERRIVMTVTFGDLARRPSAIYSLMAVTGYLKAVKSDGGYFLSIPNRKLFGVFTRIFISSSFTDYDAAANFEEFSDAVLSDDITMMEKKLYTLMAETTGCHILDDEHSFQISIIGLLMALSGKYRITADFESGEGYHDIRMESKDGKGCNVIMELKRSNSESQLEQDARKAIQQIREKDYAHDPKGQTILYGISFYGKVPHIVSETL